ncbi:MAG: SRPBCC family protein [Acidobacteriota bacterium]|nr:SRPBCC family protein [Acidobacteriota bacterium]
MILSNEFTVGATIEETWHALMDVERVAACLPGARIEPVGEDGCYRGALKLKVGPVTMAYEGTVRLEDVDDSGRSLSYYAVAREANGAGGAAATIRARLTPEDGEARTRLDVETDLNVTGRAAQFGRGITQSVATKMLGTFADGLERMIEHGGADVRAPGDAVAGEPRRAGGRTSRPAASAASGQEASGQEALDLGGALASLVSPRAVAVAAAALCLAYLAGRRQRTIRVVIVQPPE